MGAMSNLVNKLVATGNLEEEELTELLQFRNEETSQYLYEQAQMICNKKKNKKVEIWGRILLGNFCKNDCKMCGLQRGNRFVKRYRMDMDHILRFCHDFDAQGVKGFVLESGNDPLLGEEKIAEIILAIHSHHPKTKIILALGEKNEGAYLHWKTVGAVGYLLAHGSANENHFKKIYPANTSFLLKKQHQWQLRNIEYLLGDELLVGIPYQTVKDVVDDLRYMKEQGVNIIDIRTFMPALHTVFERERSGNGDMAIYIMAIMRLMLPNAYILADPVLECVKKNGRVQALEAGADVLLVDAPEADILSSYCVYQRKSGRTQLGFDDLDQLKMQIQEKGFQF